MSEKTNLISAGADIAGRNKRYVIWFYILNLVFAHFGAAAFSDQAHGILDHSLYADKLLHGFNVAVFTELLARPEFGSIPAASHRDAERDPELRDIFFRMVEYRRHVLAIFDTLVGWDGQKQRVQ